MKELIHPRPFAFADDGVVSVDENVRVLMGECDDQAPDMIMCSFYVQLLEPFLPSAGETYEEFVENIRTEGQSVQG